MPRTARITFSGGFYHIYNRGLHKNVVFRNEYDYKKFLNKLAEILLDGDWKVYAYCLLPSHYHMLIEQKSFPLEKLMKRLLTSYSVYFNRKYNRSGPLFQDRFKSKIVQKDTYFLEVSRYIHLNPVKAKIVNSPEKYVYSSLVEYVGRVDRQIVNKDCLIRLLDNNSKSISSYLKFVKEGMNKDLKEFNPYNNNRDIIGSRTFVSHRKKALL